MRYDSLCDVICPSPPSKLWLTIVVLPPLPPASSYSLYQVPTAYFDPTIHSRIKIRMIEKCVLELVQASAELSTLETSVLQADADKVRQPATLK